MLSKPLWGRECVELLASLFDDDEAIMLFDQQGSRGFYPWSCARTLEGWVDDNGWSRSVMHDVVAAQGIHCGEYGKQYHRKKDAFVGGRNFVVEFDNIPSLTEQVQLAQQFPLPATAAVFSGNKSIHFIWSVDKRLDEREWNITARRWVEYWRSAGADANYKSITQGIRLPGFYHSKSGARAELRRDLSTFKRVSYDAFIGHLPLVRVQTTNTVVVGEEDRVAAWMAALGGETESSDTEVRLSCILKDHGSSRGREATYNYNTRTYYCFACKKSVKYNELKRKLKKALDRV